MPISGMKIARMISLPLLRTELMGKSNGPQRFKDWRRRLQEVFLTHTPPIYVEDYIGSGGFSRVFRASSDYEGITEFAIKILRPELVELRKKNTKGRSREEMRVKDVKKRFTNESYVQWALSQNLSDRVAESVVKVYDHGEFDSKEQFRFILMERMEATLRTFMKRPDFSENTPRMLMRKARLMARIARMIFNIHLEGIIHRDIKPENIFFTGRQEKFGQKPAVSEDDLRVKLGDFGTVRWIKTYTEKHDGIIIGSQWYLSPEQIYDPENLDTRTDVYSFGVVCYELLYGRHPKAIDADTQTSSILKELARAKPVRLPPPKGFEPLNDIIFRCMADLSERYQSMGEVAADLRAFAQTLRD